MVHVLSVAALVLSTIAATDKQVEWQADYGKALAATRADDRPLLVVLDVPNDPKSAVGREQLETEQAKLLDAYQLCHVDASTKYGKKVAQAFKAEKFPFTAIIDKTGSVVLCKKSGKITEVEWGETLATHKKGERKTPIYHTKAYREESEGLDNSKTSSTGLFSKDSATKVVSPSYCPSCQRKAQ